MRILLRHIILIIALGLYTMGGSADAQPKLSYMGFRIGMTYTEFWKLVDRTAWTNVGSDSGGVSGLYRITIEQDSQEPAVSVGCKKSPDTRLCPSFAGGIGFVRLDTNGRVSDIRISSRPYSPNEFSLMRVHVQLVFQQLARQFGQPKQRIGVPPDQLTLDTLRAHKYLDDICLWEWGWLRKGIRSEVTATLTATTNGTYMVSFWMGIIPKKEVGTGKIKIGVPDRSK